MKNKLAGFLLSLLLALFLPAAIFSTAQAEPDKPGSAETIVVEARNWLDAQIEPNVGKARAFQRALRTHLVQHSNDAEALFQLARTMAITSNYHYSADARAVDFVETEKMLEKVRKLDPKRVEVDVLLVYVMTRLGDYPAARLAYQRAYKAGARNGWLELNNAALMNVENLRPLAEEKAAYQKVVDSDPDNTKIRITAYSALMKFAVDENQRDRLIPLLARFREKAGYAAQYCLSGWVGMHALTGGHVETAVALVRDAAIQPNLDKSTFDQALSGKRSADWVRDVGSYVAWAEAAKDDPAGKSATEAWRAAQIYAPDIPALVDFVCPWTSLVEPCKALTLAQQKSIAR